MKIVMKETTIAFIGAGNLTRAIIAGLIAAQFDPQKIWVSNPSQSKLDFFAERFGVHTTLSNCEAVAHGHVVILAAKALKTPSICAEIKSCINHQPLIISVAVGATLDLFKKWLKS